MNVTEVLQITAEALSEIQIPARLAEQVGKPILGCIGNLRLCMEALERPAAAAEGPSPAAAGAPQQAGEPGEDPGETEEEGEEG